jgi:hypothetical protein
MSDAELIVAFAPLRNRSGRVISVAIASAIAQGSSVALGIGAHCAVLIADRSWRPWNTAPDPQTRGTMRSCGVGRRVDEIMRPRVLIAGGGVAALETLLALRALAGDRVDITILAPELKFVNRSMAVDQPFKRQRVRGLRLRDTAAELDARWHRGALDPVEHDHRRAITKDGDELSYDTLVLAIGAHPERELTSEGMLTYRDGRDGPS